ncbi:MAG: 4Fe-4S dicluster domain-containing protein [Candidatus Bathyarchaeales archaeon]
MPEKSSSNFDIFLLLSESGEKAKKKQRTELLSSLGIKEFFPEGSISIDKRTCWGVECKLCIKACPTNALYWKTGEVGITDDLCVYCGACVLSCMVDDCIKVERKREDGTTERFSKPRAFVKLAEKINAKKRLRRVSELFPTVERYLEKYKTQK